MFKRLSHNLRHFLTPHHTNNFRARTLHNPGILFIIGLFLTFNLVVRSFDSSPYHILGFTSSVTIDEVVQLTNNQRITSGLPVLKYSEALADAARRKADNMLTEDYWAHNSPSGISPWHWFAQAGYSYLHAGENLAKDFGNTDRMMNAWMNSPTHKENIINQNYQEIGVAVVPGILQGQETVLVVQLFGAPATSATPAVSQLEPSTQGVSVVAKQPVVAQIEVQENTIEAVEQVTEEVVVADTTPSLPQLDEFSLKQTVSITTTILLLLILILDLFLAESKRLTRRVGKNWAHIIFINVILILVTIVQAGRIL